MIDILIRIKRAVLAGRYAFSEKARIEMEADGITELDVAESILNAVAIYKTIRSESRFRSRLKEYLYVIQSTNLNGLPIYSKGKLMKVQGQDVYYFLISSKKGM
jgi:hypothetical protein